MKKMLTKIFGIVLTASILIATPVSTVSAAEQTNIGNEQSKFVVSSTRESMFTDARINIVESNEGMILEFATTTSRPASVIGVKDIVIKKKVWYGWSTIYTSAGGESTDRMMAGYSILLKNAEKGVTYKVSCTHYATIGTYDEVPNSVEFVY